MSFLIQGASALDEEPCQYGTSRILCRGPKRTPTGNYVAFLGDSETFGRFVEWPFAALIEQTTGRVCVNLGAINVGLDSYLHEPDLLEMAAGAEAVVVQVMGAQNLTNRFYRVHPRRNDRFLEPTPELVAMFPEVDFTEFNFNMHMLNTLKKTSPNRFRVVQREIKALWVTRMGRLVEKIGRQTLLLWLQYMDRGPLRLETQSPTDSGFVDSKMVNEIRPFLAGVVTQAVCSATETGEMDSMIFGHMQEPVAEKSLGPTTHTLIASAVADALPVPAP